MEISQKIRGRTTIQSSNSISGYFSTPLPNTNLKRHVFPYVHCNIIHNSQDTEITYVSINICIDKKDVVCVCTQTHTQTHTHTHWNTQFSSVAQSCPTLCNPMNRSTPGLPVCHQLREFTQTHVHRVGDAIQPFHSLLSPSSPVPNPSLPASVSFPVSQLFASDGQNIGASASALILPMNNQD